MKRKKKTSDDLIAHFQKRCIERLGYILNQRFLKEEMCKRDGLVKKLCRQSNSRSFWKIKRAGTDYVIVYDNIRHCFVTIMYYNEWMQQRRPDLKFQIMHTEYAPKNINDGVETV